MKIDQNVTFLKKIGGASVPASSKEGVNASQPALGKLAMENPARSASPTPLLPSTNGDFDAARVARIREDISAGRYQVNTAQIADGLLATVRDLLDKKTP